MPKAQSLLDLGSSPRLFKLQHQPLHFPGDYLGDFPGTLSGQPVDDSHPAWQMFPYTVRDVYGTAVIPEDLDYVHSDGSNITDMLNQARENLVVRDGVASFFYHPFLSVAQLQQVVDGVRALGYTFVAGQDAYAPLGSEAIGTDTLTSLGQTAWVTVAAPVSAPVRYFSQPEDAPLYRPPARPDDEPGGEEKAFDVLAFFDSQNQEL